MFVNVVIPQDDLVLDPHLKPFVEKLALECPNFVLTSKGISEHFFSFRSVDGQNTPPDGKRFLQRLDVRDKPTGEYLGRIGVYRKYRSRGPDDIAMFVESWRITNERGARNTTYSTKLPSIMRTAKRALIPKGYEELLDHAKDEIEEAFLRSVRDLTSAIASGRLLPGSYNTTMQLYLYHSLTGAEVPPTIQFPDITPHFKTEKYKTGVEEFYLAKHMGKYHSDDRIRYVVLHNGMYVYRLKGDDAIHSNSFDDLPDWMKDHIGVLQLMEDRELVKDVGFRLSDTHFAVLQPE
jgi:hypothetical protein